MVNRRQVIKSATAAATVFAMPKYASASSAFNGYYPTGSWMPAKQPMIQVYPRPDSETNTWARHRWAYYDGVHPVQYKIPLGVSFGAFPYVYQLLSGPPGMTLGANIWQPGWSFAQSAAAGYGYLQWTPSAAVSGATVSVLVTDQQKNTLTITFTVSTSSSTSQFIFLDSVHGSDSTGNGTITAPWASFTKAFGASYSASVNANALCYFRAGTYAIPIYTDNDLITGAAFCELNTTTKPSALMGFPGDTPPVITMTNAQFATNSGGTDLFMQRLNPNGYASGIDGNARIILAAGDGNKSARMVFDNNVWTNSGYGSVGKSNATGYFMDGNSSNLMPYQFINNCSETNRQSGFPGNNYGGCSFYGAINCLVQGNTINQPGLNMDGAWYFKSDVENGCMRGNFVAGAGVTHAFDWGQTPNNLTMNSETCYNILIVASGGGGIFLPQTNDGTFGTLWCYRNTVIGSGSPGSGCLSVSGAHSGPFVFDSNAIQNASLASGSNIETDGLNLVKASGMLDTTTGALSGSYASYVGAVGAQIGVASSFATPKAPVLKGVS